MLTKFMGDSKEKRMACQKFFEELTEKMGDAYEVAPVLGNDESRYLVPKGRSFLVSYYGKPRHSFRLGHKWNFFAPISKCEQENYIQCLCPDMPKARKRNFPGSRSEARYAWAVAALGSDNKYHVIYGEVYNRITNKWSWIEVTVDEYLKSRNAA